MSQTFESSPLSDELSAAGACWLPVREGIGLLQKEKGPNSAQN
jgi:hypothetical protein